MSRNDGSSDIMYSIEKKGNHMAEIKKCPKCGGTIHTKVAGNYICSQCGSAIPESEVIIESETSQSSSPDSEYTEFASSASRAGNAGASYDSSYTDFRTAQPESPKATEKSKKEKVKKEKKQKPPKPPKPPKQPRQKVKRPRRSIMEFIKSMDITLWWPVLAAGVAGIDFTIVFILMLIYRFRYLPLWLTLLGLSVYLMTSLLLWPVFDKAGESPWKALIPVLNSYTLYEISGYKGWMCFLTLIPTVGQLIGCVLGALTAVSLARKFGKDAKWGIIYLFLLFFVGWVLIAVTNMMYNRSAGHQKDMSPFQII